MLVCDRVSLSRSLRRWFTSLSFDARIACKCWFSSCRTCKEGGRSGGGGGGGGGWSSSFKCSSFAMYSAVVHRLASTAATASACLQGRCPSPSSSMNGDEGEAEAEANVVVAFKDDDEEEEEEEEDVVVIAILVDWPTDSSYTPRDFRRVWIELARVMTGFSPEPLLLGKPRLVRFIFCRQSRNGEDLHWNGSIFSKGAFRTSFVLAFIMTSRAFSSAVVAFE